MGECRLVITRLRQTLVATVEGTVDAGALSTLIDSLSEAQDTQRVDSVIFEVSACEMMDIDEFITLQKAVRTADWLGMRTIVAGLKPGIVAYVVSSGVDLGNLRAALDLEYALEALSREHDERAPEADPEDDAETESQSDGPGEVRYSDGG
ncbi:MAG: hypothetical protein OES21_06230 [Myxococcales bacterium]|jgi:hypothetical protein|nr:hypothetical protein [Myxococcales bacterium]